MEHDQTIIKKPQANSTFERVHQVIINMVYIANLDMQDTCKSEIDKILSNVS